MSKHTPGKGTFINAPWRWDQNHRCVVDSTNTIVRVSGTAQPHGYLPPDDPSYFHGRAFAAAPQMYEALKTMVAPIEHLDGCLFKSDRRMPCQCGFNARINAAVDAARAVLTEIEGESNVKA